jgi:predicted alpha/beta superfamily hydrolase
MRLVMNERRRGAVTAALALVTALASGVVAARAVADASTARIMFIVSAPASTPADAVLWVSGNASALGAWNGAGLKLEPRGARVYGASVAAPAGASLEFKITRGSWDTVEKGPGGEEIANRRHEARDGDTVRVAVATWRDQTADRALKRPSTRTGDVRVHAAFPSRFVKPRDVLVWLPPGYAADTTRFFPVLYFHDGNNMLDDSTSFVGEWHLDEIADRLIRDGAVRPFIAVAIYNTPDRMSEYVPIVDKRHPGDVRAGDYARFLIEELKPVIDHDYRALKDSASTGIVGSSLGGLVSLAIALVHSNVFGLVGAVSPSAWWGDRWIVTRAARTPPSLRVWLDIGTAESGTPAESAHDVESVRALRDAMLRAGIPTKSLHYEEVQGARHNEAAWSTRLDRILVFLLPATR